MKQRKHWSLPILNAAPVCLFLFVLAVFALQSPRFLEASNLTNIIVQSSGTAVAAIGMTLVLITAGVDLSVGSVMFVAVAVAGRLIFNDQPVWLGFTAAICVGIIAGLLNALFITRLRVAPFVVTLAMLFVARGFGLWITNTRAMNMQDTVTQLGTAKILGIPLPILLLALVALGAHILLTRTPFGRQLYAVGGNLAGARKAGINVTRILVITYALCGACAALSGLISLTQTGAVSPSFGDRKEFLAIAAAVLGGTSLFGGRGSVLPGTILGALLIQAVENGLVIVNADPYIYPIITSSIIFLAVLLDSFRSRALRRLGQRKIRVEPTSG